MTTPNLHPPLIVTDASGQLVKNQLYQAWKDGYTAAERDTAEREEVMTIPTREEALKFIQEIREKKKAKVPLDLDKGNWEERIARLWVLFVCNPDDPEEKQAEDYIKARTDFFQRKKAWEEREQKVPGQEEKCPSCGQPKSAPRLAGCPKEAHFSG